MINKIDLITMKLLHYFITVKNYSPVMVQGAKNEIWLENLENDIKIIRIVSNYIHNDEQMQFDIFKTKRLANKIKRKTLSFKMKVLNIFLDLGDNVNFKEFEKAKDKVCIYINAHEESDILNNKFMKENFRDIKNNFEYDEEGFGLFLKITNEINLKNRADAIKAEEVFEPKRIIVTYVIIGILVAIHMYGLLFNQSTKLVTMFSVYGPYIRAYHEYYRLITGTLLHGGIIHLLMNCYALFIIGNQIETFYGKWKMLIIYIFSAITGSLLSITLSNYASIGASGAIFGLMGSLLYFGYHYRVYLGSTWKTNVLPIVILNLVIGFIVPGIDYFGHIGGLIGGVLISMALGFRNEDEKRDKINGIILSIIFLVFLIYLGIFVK